MKMRNRSIIVTGSSGFVGSTLSPLLKNIHNTFGIDTAPSVNTNILNNIAEFSTDRLSEKLKEQDLYIVNLAAARFDFGAKANDYFEMNVADHQKFLDRLDGLNIQKFVHVSSVAAIDGRTIPYCDSLNCDDAYRSTKFLQEDLIRQWCKRKDIELVVLYPSAIFSHEQRSDTNIGKMQKWSRLIPFIPLINVRKSLTFLPNFCDFIIQAVSGNLAAGNYLTIERPVFTVTEMIKILSGRECLVLRIPFFKQFLRAVAGLLFVFGGFGRFDLKLTPNRVTKLFSDTSFEHVSGRHIDTLLYNKDTETDLRDILIAMSGVRM